MREREKGVARRTSGGVVESGESNPGTNRCWHRRDFALPEDRKPEFAQARCHVQPLLARASLGCRYQLSLGCLKGGVRHGRCHPHPMSHNSLRTVNLSPILKSIRLARTKIPITQTFGFTPVTALYVRNSLCTRNPARNTSP